MRIPVHLDQDFELSRQENLLLGGIPIPRGQVHQAGWMNLRLGTEGEQPIHTSPAAYWPDGSIKWLHLCGKISLDRSRQHAVELDTTLLEHLSGMPQLSVDRQDRNVHITGGPVAVTVGPDVEGLLQGRMESDHGPVVCGILPELDVVGPEEDAGRRPCRFVVDSEEVQLPVEEDNRVVVRLTGRWLDPDNEPMAELRLFVEVLAELAEVRLQPVLIYLGHSERDLIRRCELKIATTLREAVPDEEDTLPLIKPRITPEDEPWPDPRPIDRFIYGFSEAQGRGAWDHVRPFVPLVRWPAARLVQSGSSFYRIEKRVAPGRSWVKGSEGQRAQGWCHLNDGRAGITAAIRRFWQEYPSALEVDAGTGIMTFGFWPDTAEPLDMRRYSLVRHGTEGYEYGIGMFPMDTHGPSGIGKARELALQFHDQGIGGPGLSHAAEQRAVAERALAFIHPLYPMTSGDYFTETCVVGRMAATDKRIHPKAEAQVVEIFEFLASEQYRRGWYGLMNYGDMPSSFYSELDRWAYDDGGYGWVNTEHLPDMGLWLNALRASRRDWLDLAINMTRHNRDVDTYHVGQFTGSGSRHNVQHWGDADKEWRVAMPLVRRLHYYVTADPWTAEVIRTTIERYRSYTRTSATAPSMASAFIGLAVRWEMSGEPADRQPVMNMADLYASAFREDGRYYRQLHVNIATGEGRIEGDEIAGNVFFFDGFGGQHLLCELAEMLEHQGLIDAMIRYSLSPNYTPSQGPGENINRLVSLALAHRHTNDPQFLERIKETLEVCKFELQPLGGTGMLEDPPHRSPVNRTRRNKYICGLARYLHAVPYGLRAVADAEETNEG